MNSSNNICVGKLKNGTQCHFKGKNTYNNKLYCNVHKKQGEHILKFNKYAFGNLPNQLIDSILIQYLTMSDIMNLSLVSQLCNNLCHTTSNISEKITYGERDKPWINKFKFIVKYWKNIKFNILIDNRIVFTAQQSQCMNQINFNRYLYINNIDSYSKLKEVTFTDVPNLSNDNLISFKDCESVKIINCRGITDVSLIQNVKSFTYDCSKLANRNYNWQVRLEYNTPVIDFNKFVHLESITLDNYHNSLNVELFKNINTVSLIECSLLTNVNTLTHVKHLNLMYSNVTNSDINIDFQCIYLNIYSTKCINDISIPPTVIELYANSINILNPYNLQIKKCSILNSSCTLDVFTHLKKLKYLDISYSKYTNVDVLCNIEHLILKGCNNLKTFDVLYTCESIDISDNHRLINIDNLCNVSIVIAKCCSRLKLITVQFNCKILDLEECIELNSVEYMTKVVYLNISKCSNIIDYELLSGNKIINITECKQIINISPLRNVKKLIINDTLCIEN